MINIKTNREPLILGAFFCTFFTVSQNVVSNDIRCDVELKTTTSLIDDWGFPVVHDKQNMMYSYKSFPSTTAHIVSLGDLESSQYDSSQREYVDGQGKMISGTIPLFTKDGRDQVLYAFQSGTPSELLANGNYI